MPKLSSAEPIISVSGLRGIVGESLTPEIAVRYAAAFVADLAAGPIVLARDGRSTGPMIADAVRAALLASGRDVLDAGVAATPTVGVLVREHHAAGGIQVSASHNPAPYNGLKLFGGDGRVIPAAAGEKVIARYRSGDAAWAAHDAIGRAVLLADTTSRHRDLVLAIVDVERIRRRGFKVLVDANHGSGSVLGRVLLDAFGCETIWLGETPDGQFDHLPEPTAENLAGVAAAVRRQQVDIGFCQDPDADRLAIIDKQGRYIGEEYTLALCVAHVLAMADGRDGRPALGPVVTNCSTSRMSQDLAEKYGVAFFRSPVGEANVTDVMRRERALIGGEGSGGAIDPRVGYVRDSFVGMALVLDMMAQRGQPVSALADELPRYAIEKDKVTGAGGWGSGAGAEALKRIFPDAAVDASDGLRLDWPDRWLLVRASNTEPIVRIVAEAPHADAARRLCRDAASALNSTAARASH
ncbi:MAG: phosphoglucosamine mutase [Pirellulales bacterium]